MTKKKIILVVGSHSEKQGEKHRNKCQFVAEQLADRDVHLLTGGGPGVMAKVSKYFFDRPNRRGLCLGVLPCATDKQGVVQRNTTKEGYPNEWVEIPIQTHLPGSDPKGDESRNHINALTASVVIGLPGGKGTLAEMELAIRYGKKCVALVDKVDDITGLGDSDFRKSIEVVGKQRLIDFLDEVAPKK